MKSKLFLVLICLATLYCCDSEDDSEPDPVLGCTDDKALNYSFSNDTDDGSCIYSTVTYYAKFNLFQNIPITRIDISIDGVFIGSINNGFIWSNGPGNCSSTGTVQYQFLDGSSVDWNATLYLANGQQFSTSGTRTPNSLECIKINVTI